MGISSAVTRLKEVFKDHQELNLGFGTFLSSDYNKTTLQRKKEKPVTIIKAYSFAKKVKARFKGNDVHVHKAFLHNLNMYTSRSKSIIDVYHRFGILFWDHPDLLVELNCFLPASSKGPVREGGIAIVDEMLHSKDLQTGRSYQNNANLFIHNNNR
ncbi:hypothetical protein Bca4012_094590 [Brassica carinata]